MSTERIPRKGRTHNDDLTKPVAGNAVMATDKELHGESCFSHLWNMGNELCAMCADNEMCGVLYHKRVSKMVKAIEAEGPAYMDTVDFDVINKSDLIIWLKIKPRRSGELVAKVAEMVKCDDVDTLRYWTKSFILEHPRLSVKNNIIVVEN